METFIDRMELTRDMHCTHPNQEWCDCDWCRFIATYDKAPACHTIHCRHYDLAPDHKCKVQIEREYHGLPASFARPSLPPV